jgi:hypothetical protein
MNLSVDLDVTESDAKGGKLDSSGSEEAVYPNRTASGHKKSSKTNTAECRFSC